MQFFLPGTGLLCPSTQPLQLSLYPPPLPKATLPPLSRSGAAPGNPPSPDTTPRSPHFEFHLATGLPTLAQAPDDPVDANPPIHSLVIPSVPPSTTHDEYIPATATRLSKAQWTHFQESLPTATALRLEQSFGKDNINHSFTTQICFRHTFIFLLKSGLLVSADLNNLYQASPRAQLLSRLLQSHADIDFRPLRGYRHTWEQQTELEVGRKH